jgi:hypothetical protein
MGTRIHAYAIDLPRFDTFLNTSLADLLRQYQRDGIEEKTRISFTMGNAPDHYFATPHGSIEAFLGEGPERKRDVITDDQLRSIDALQCSAREHLSDNNIYQAKWLLEAFSNCKGINFIKCLVDGQRRGWVGSVFQSAQLVLNASEYRELESLFVRVLRNIDCGFKLSIGDIGFVTNGLPFKPDDDPDVRFGRWTEQECSMAMTLLTKLEVSSPKFQCPPGFAMLDNSDSEWHEWAQSNVLSLLQIRDLNYKVCNVFSFIG